MKKVLYSLLCAGLLIATTRTVKAQDSLTGTVAARAGSSVNLTALGTQDWAHFGQNSATDFNHKAVGGVAVGLISNIVVGGGTASQYTDDNSTFSWADGTPAAAVAATNKGVFGGAGATDLSITVPAATTSRLLRVYVGGFNSSGTLTATLSGGATTYTDSSASSTGVGNTDGSHYYVVYTLTYKAATAGQTLTVAWTQTGGGGNIVFPAAALTAPPTVVPAAPTGVTAVAGDTRIGIGWNAVTGADTYTVKRGASATGPFTIVASGLTNTGYQDTGLTNGTTYFYVVSATNTVGEGPNSAAASAKPLAGLDGTGLKGEYFNNPNGTNPTFAAGLHIIDVPAEVVNFDVDLTRPTGVPHDNIAVRWSGSVKAQVSGQYIFSTASDDGIQLYVDGALVIDNYVYQGTTTRSSAPITFAAGSLHIIRVLWFQGGGGGVARLSWSYPGQGNQIIPAYALFPTYPQQAPPAPVLTAAPQPQGAILKWSAPENATSFTLKRSLVSGGPYTTIADNLTTGTYADTGLTNGTTYYYIVTANNTFGSTASNQASVVPTPPVIGNGNGLGGLYYAGADVDFTPELTAPIGFAIAPTINYTQGNVVDFAPNLDWPSFVPHDNFTAVWTGQVLASFTGSYIFRIVGDDGVRLSLNTGTGLNIIANGPFFQGPTVFDSAPINLVAGQKYDIKMEFFQGGGGRTAQLIWNPLGLGFQIIPQTQLFATFAQKPDAVTDLAALGGAQSVTLAWTSPFYASSYNIFRSLSAAGPFTQIATGVGATTYIDTGLINGTTYYYKVVAVNNVGSSGDSNVASAAPANPIIGNGDGLYGTYYPGDDIAYAAEMNTPILYHIDPTINFSVDNAVNYNPGPWPAGVPHDHYTVAWTGQLLAPFTASYVFQIVSDDGSRLSLDTGSGLNIIDDNSFYQGPTAKNSTTVNLTAGQKYNIKMEFFQGGGGATAQLLYSIQGTPFQIIPQTQLFTNFTVAPSRITDLTAEGGSRLVNLAWTSAPLTSSYTVKRSTTQGGPYTIIASGLTSPVYTDTTVTNGTTYYYVVAAVNNAGSSPNSNEASATPNTVALRLRYNFENGPSGTDPDPITDTTGNGNTGASIGGDIGFTRDAAEGMFAGITHSATQYIALPDTFDFSDRFTVFTYAKLNEGFAIQTLLATNGSGGATSGFSLYVNDSNDQSHAIVFETNALVNGVNVQSKVRSATGVFPLGDGKYHSVAAVVSRASGTVSLYFDGAQVLANGIVDKQWPTASGANRLGLFPSGDQIAINSQFDDFRVYNGLLSATDIAVIANTGMVAGRIALEGVSDLSAIPAAVTRPLVTVEFRTPGTTTILKTVNINLTPVGAGNPNGTYSITGVTNGTYDIAFKTKNSLRVVLPNVTVSGPLNLPNIILPGGDALADNFVDIGDFGLLVNAFNGDITVPGGSYDPAPDFNYDGVIDIADFGTLVNEFNNAGAP